jgi:predicted glycosyltransferase
MRILIDITHPAHAHFFRPTLPVLRARGHEVAITSRDKDVTLRLLDAFGIEHEMLSRAGRTRWQLLVEMLVRVSRLRGVVKRFRPHLILAREGVFACQAGWLTGVPAISIDDTDDAPIQHALSFPFAWRVYTDRAYRKSVGSKQRFFKGVSCLAYLQPGVFEPDPSVLEAAGLGLEERLIFLRLVSWTSNHDYGHRGFDRHDLNRLLDRLEGFGRIVMSSEHALDEALEPYRITLDPQQIHHLMAFCSLYIGESPTMAAECAVLGVPAIHVSTRRVWYTEELQRYELLHNVDNSADCLALASNILQDSNYHLQNLKRRDHYLQEADDLVAVVLKAVEEVRPAAH